MNAGEDMLLDRVDVPAEIAAVATLAARPLIAVPSERRLKSVRFRKLQLAANDLACDDTAASGAEVGCGAPEF